MANILATAVAPSTFTRLWLKFRSSSVVFLQSAAASLQAPCSLMWQSCEFNFVSAHFHWLLSSDAKLSTFMMVNWISSSFRELLWLSPVMMLVTLSGDKLFWSIWRCWSEWLDFSSSESDTPIWVLYSHSSFTLLLHNALITYHFLSDCYQAEGPLTWTLMILPWPAGHRHYHPVCCDLGVTLSCPETCENTVGGTAVPAAPDGGRSEAEWRNGGDIG